MVSLIMLNQTKTEKRFTIETKTRNTEWRHAWNVMAHSRAEALRNAEWTLSRMEPTIETVSVRAYEAAA